MARPSFPSFALVVAVLSAQPACTLIGAGAAYGIDSQTPGPYEHRRWVGSGKPDMSALARLDVSPGDTIQVLLKSGTQVEGTYVRLEAPTASDPEMYVVLEGSTRPRALEYLPASEVESIGVEVVDYAWIAGGAAAGLVLDILLFLAFGSIELSS